MSVISTRASRKYTLGFDRIEEVTQPLDPLNEETVMENINEEGEMEIINE